VQSSAVCAIGLSDVVAKVGVLVVQYVRDEHRVDLVAYHLLWRPKCRKRVGAGVVGGGWKRLIREV